VGEKKSPGGGRGVGPLGKGGESKKEKEEGRPGLDGKTVTKRSRPNQRLSKTTKRRKKGKNCGVWKNPRSLMTGLGKPVERGTRAKGMAQREGGGKKEKK